MTDDSALAHEILEPFRGEALVDEAMSVLHKRVAAALTRAREKTWEAAYRVRCARCHDGEPVIVEEKERIAGIHGVLPPYFHVVKNGAMNGEDLWCRCDAGFLRDAAVGR